MKFKAPKHVSGIFAGGFEVRADANGFAELPEGAGGNVADALLAEGFTKLDADPAPPAPKPETRLQAKPATSASAAADDA